MPEEVKKVVQGDSTTPPPKEGANVEGAGQGEDDKSKNFSELRKKLETIEAENAELKRKLEGGDGSERTLLVAPTEGDDGKGKGEDVVKVLFERDTKEATRLWNKTHSVSKEEWDTIRSRVSLRGDETVSVIQDRITEAYESLPRVRKERDAKIANEAKREAMKNLRDDELDLGSGGDGEDFSSDDESGKRLSNPEKKFLKSFNVDSKEAAKIDRSKNANEWSEGPQAKRSFFQA